MSSFVTYGCLLEGEIFGLAVAQAHLQHVEHVLIDVVGRGAEDRDHLRVRAPPDGLHADKPSGAQRELQLLANLHVLHQTAEGAAKPRQHRRRRHEVARGEVDLYNTTRRHGPRRCRGVPGARARKTL